MAYEQINANINLNILNMDENGILLIYTIFWAFYMFESFKFDARLMSY